MGRQLVCTCVRSRSAPNPEPPSDTSIDRSLSHIGVDTDDVFGDVPQSIAEAAVGYWRDIAIRYII